MKKFVTILCLALAAIFAVSDVASATSNDIIAINETPEDVYSAIVDECLNYDEYGGAYFEGNILHLTSTSPSMTESRINEFFKSNNIKQCTEKIVIDKVTYKYAELYTAKKLIRDKMDKYNIVGSYTNPKTNSIIIELTNYSKETVETLKEITGIKNINYEIVRDSDIIDDAVYMRGGCRITFPGYGCSLGGGIKFSDGSYGFITTGHNVSVSDVYKYEGTPFGTASVVKNENNMDIALITRTDSNYKASNLMNNGTSCTRNGSAIVNDNITMYGSTSGTSTGTIIATDYDTDDGYYDLIKADYARASGDSGGAIVATRTTGNVFVGIHKGTRGGFTVATNWGIVKNAYGLNRWSVSES